MLDQRVAQTGTRIQGETFDLVVIGAGIAGLNALNSATEYLAEGARVLLIDQKAAAGGMWNTAYNYVRLHQPHPMFTVGNMQWDWQRPMHYLAARDEVQCHLANALAPIGERVQLDLRFGHTVERCSEIEMGQTPVAEITYHPNDTPAKKTTVYAKRAIYASGLNYALAEPLSLSSQHIHSIIPQDLLETLKTHPNAPVVVVGGGKTGMDTILATLSADPGREVSLIKGRGTNFLNRTKFFPTGLKRWTSGKLVSRLFRDLAMTFDGDNQDHVLANLREHYSSDPSSNDGVFLFGLQSEEEQTQVKSGIKAAHDEYLTDIVDSAAGPQMRMRDGAVLPIREGSIVVNCTGSFFRSTQLSDHMPLLSPNGCILSINARDGWHFLTSVSAYITVHLLYQNALTGHGFYSCDLEALFRKNRNAWVGATAAQAYMNQVIAVQVLPMQVLDRCGLDLDRWYPFPRRMAGLIRMKATAARDIAHCRRVLDRVAKRFDIHAAPIG